MKRFPGALVCLAITVVFCSPAGAAGDAAALCRRLHSFDISCRFTDPRFGKKTCGVEHGAAFSELIRLKDKESALAYVESELVKSAERLEALEALEAAAPQADAGRTAAYPGLIAGAAVGDPAALAALRREGPAAIPALLKFRDKKGVIPPPRLRRLLAELESAAESAVENGAQLDAGAVRALVNREKAYATALGRAVIALEGTRRPLPIWLPFVYAYGIGLIPFLIGAAAAIRVHGGLKPRLLAPAALTYVLYVCLHAFFQFAAPRL
ncbi:MAG: hypothetical protein AB1742_11240 [bacterium]